MLLNDGIVAGLCTSFSMSAAQLHALLSAEETARHFRLDRKVVLEIIGYSLAWTVPFAVVLWTVAGLLEGADHRPGHDLQASFALLFAVVWAVVVIGRIANSGAKRVKLETGVDVLKRTQIRTALTGGAIGMILVGIYLFGSHVLRAN